MKFPYKPSPLGIAGIMVLIIVVLVLSIQQLFVRTTLFHGEVLVVENISASTNTPAVTFTIYTNGSATYTGDGFGTERGKPHSVKSGTLDLTQLKTDLAQLSANPSPETAKVQLSCPKPVSFATSTTIQYKDLTSGDISCGGTSFAWQAVSKDIDDLEQIVIFGNVSASPTPQNVSDFSTPEASPTFTPLNNSTIEFKPGTTLPQALSYLTSQNITFTPSCLDQSQGYYFKFTNVNFATIPGRADLYANLLTNSHLFCAVTQGLGKGSLAGQQVIDAYALPTTTSEQVTAVLNSLPGQSLEVGSTENPVTIPVTISSQSIEDAIKNLNFDTTPVEAYTLQ